MSEPLTGAHLRCRSGELAGRTFELGAETTIGRGPENDIVLESPTVSERHARIAFSGDRYVVEDLDSTHGTRVDGTQIGAPTPLERMHVIEFSDVEFIFTPGAAPMASAPDQESDGKREEVATAERESPGSQEFDAAVGKPTDQAPNGATIVDTGGFGTLPELRDAEGDDPNQTEVMTSFPTEPLIRFEIVVALPDGGETTFPLGPGDNIVGRGDDCDITIADPAMWLGRKHAVLRVIGDRVELADLGSVNGTFVEGRRIETAELEPGSTFVFGPHLKVNLRTR